VRGGNARGVRLGRVLALGVAAFAVSACSHARPQQGSGRTFRHASANDPASAVVPVKRRGIVVLMRGLAAGPVALAGNYAVWETGGVQDVASRALLARNLRTGVVRTLARDPVREYGLAGTRNEVIYAARAGGALQLRSIDLRGGDLRVLTRSLLAPFDARGAIVAWPEGDAVRLRVRGRDMRTGGDFIALDRPRCSGRRCYRIDRVTVAEKGIVFDLGAAGGNYPSLIGLYRLGAEKPSFAEVQSDPQPDLARSSDGALYYQFQRGWMRWNFGDRRPSPTRFRTTTPWLLDHEHGRLLMSTGEGCEVTLAIRLRSDQTLELPAPGSTPVSPRGFGTLCRQFTGFAWRGQRLLAAWSLIPSLSLQTHKDVGVAGIVTTASTP
jgi:hypothetical protein